MVLRTARERGQVVDPALFTLKPPGTTNESRFLTWEQVETLASWMPDDLARIVPFAAASGLREGECLKLRDGDVDFGQGTVRVRQAKSRSGVRVVDLPPIALRLLREQLFVGHGHRSCLPLANGEAARPQPANGPLLPAGSGAGRG